MKIEEILALEDENKKIRYLKNRKTAEPNVHELLSEWDPDMHDVMNHEIRKDGKVLKEEGFTDTNGVRHGDVYESEPVNRITLGIEEDITNIHTAFTVGIEPKLNCEPNNDEEKELLAIVKAVNRKNKIKYHNKRVVRSWLSETEVAEYWYVVKDERFWSKIFTKIKKTVGIKPKAQYKLKCTIWSPFRGDKLYPRCDETGDFVALSREYKVRSDDNTETTYFMTITNKQVIMWKLDTGWVKVEEFNHGFKKLPAIYAHRDRSLCHNIKTPRKRLEELLSNFADCIDRCFFPYLILEGDTNGVPQRAGKSRMIKVSNKGKVYYLNWDQTPEAVKLELEGLIEKIYSLTNTPRISFENLKGMGQVSGTAFKFTFMGTHMAVENHAETIGEFLQRRYNFLVSAIGSINTDYESAAETIDIEPEIIPYMIDDAVAKVKLAVEASGGSVASRRTGIMLAGIVDNIDEELAQIEEEESKVNEESAFPKAGEE